MLIYCSATKFCNNLHSLLVPPGNSTILSQCGITALPSPKSRSMSYLRRYRYTLIFPQCRHRESRPHAPPRARNDRVDRFAVDICLGCVARKFRGGYVRAHAGPRTRSFTRVFTCPLRRVYEDALGETGASSAAAATATAGVEKLYRPRVDLRGVPRIFTTAL